jgi:hypothetical protein
MNDLTQMVAEENVLEDSDKPLYVEIERETGYHLNTIYIVRTQLEGGLATRPIYKSIFDNFEDALKYAITLSNKQLVPFRYDPMNFIKKYKVWAKVLACDNTVLPDKPPIYTDDEVVPKMRTIDKESE